LLEQHVLTHQDLSTAMTEARRKGCDVETILLDTASQNDLARPSAVSTAALCP
jgi:hypothetical protein